MVIKVFGSKTTVCTRRVLLTLKEKGVDYELVIVDIQKGESYTPQYKEKQPFGVVPYIDDDGFILYESRAICRYIEDKYKNQGTRLIPEDVKERALFEQGCSIELSYFNPQANPLVYEKLYAHFHGRQTDEERVKQLAGKLAEYLDVYEIILSKQEYIGGNTFTFADLSHIPMAAKLFLVGYGHLLTDRPRVAEWWNKITSRNSWQEVSADQ
jgi:glutathione S-transferase